MFLAFSLFWFAIYLPGHLLILQVIYCILSWCFWCLEIYSEVIPSLIYLFRLWKEWNYDAMLICILCSFTNLLPQYQNIRLFWFCIGHRKRLIFCYGACILFHVEKGWSILAKCFTSNCFLVICKVLKTNNEMMSGNKMLNSAIYTTVKK